MTEQPTHSEIDRWHRWFAIECNNAAWNLAALTQRDENADRTMLLNAYSAAYHWSQVGTALHVARADMALAHVHALLGHGREAMTNARRYLDYCRQNPCEDWDLAFAHAELAHAAAVSGQRDLHEQHLAVARDLGAAIQDVEDRRIFMEELARLPSEVTETSVAQSALSEHTRFGERQSHSIETESGRV